jgi:hypothetical protein
MAIGEAGGKRSDWLRSAAALRMAIKPERMTLGERRGSGAHDDHWQCSSGQDEPLLQCEADHVPSG